MAIYSGNTKSKLYLGNKKVKKVYRGASKVYSSGSTVTYTVDSGTSHTVEYDEGASVLSPTTFTPSKSGWTFVGWREDTTANSSVLTSKTMGDTPITLYAVFTQNITVTYYDNSTTAKSTASPRYYNNGNSTSASFKLAQSSKSGWTVRGWSTATTGNGSITYNNNTTFTRTSNCTLYGMYQKTCTLTASSYNNNQTATGTAYYNSNGKTVNATATIPNGASYSGWTWRGWSAASTTTANASVSYANGATYTLGTSDATIYGLYSQGITATFYSGSNKGNTQTAKGTRYYNAAGNTANASVTAPNGASLSGWTWRGWSANNTTVGNASVGYANGATISNLSGNITCYGLYSQEITCSFISNGTQTAKGTRYYNSSNNTVNASVTVPSGAAISGWTWRGWSAAATTTGNASVAYANGATISNLSAGATYYGLYQATITVTYYNGSTTASSTTGTRYYNAAGNYTNPSFTLAQTAKSGWTARGWSTGTAGNSSISYNNNTAFTRDSNVTLYGMYQQTITVTYYNNSGTASSTTGTRYWNSGKNVYVNPSFTLAQASKSGWSPRGWSTSNAGNAGITYNNNTAFTRDSNVTLYGLYSASITLSYNGNGATSGSTTSQTGTVYWAPAGTIGATFKLASNGFARTNYTFTGWDLGAVGASVTLTANKTAYAQWKASQLVVYQSVINYSNPSYTAVGASVSVSQHNTSYVTISSTHPTYGLGTGQSGYGIDDVTRYINISYNGYTSAKIEFTLAGDNVYNWDECEANVYINGSLIYDGYHAIQPGSYTLTTSSTSIPIRAVAELSDESSIGWVGIAVACKITLS